MRKNLVEFAVTLAVVLVLGFGTAATIAAPGAGAAASVIAGGCWIPRLCHSSR